MMRLKIKYFLAISVLTTLAVAGCGVASNEAAPGPEEASTDAEVLAEGREIFRTDTFGNESFWTDTMRIHEVIESAVDPTTALAVGLTAYPGPSPVVRAKKR